MMSLNWSHRGGVFFSTKDWSCIKALLFYDRLILHDVWSPIGAVILVTLSQDLKQNDQWGDVILGKSSIKVKPLGKMFQISFCGN